MLVIASLYVDALDGDSAARALQDVLAFDPQNARAIEMLQELGYEIVDENEEGAMGGAASAYESDEAEVVTGSEVEEYVEDAGADTYGGAAEPPQAGLPAYDFDDPAHAPQAAPEYGYGEPQPHAGGDGAYGAD